MLVSVEYVYEQQQQSTQACKPELSHICVQVLLLFYAGRGRLLEGKPHAIATDDVPVNLQLHFLSALNKVDLQGSHSIVLLMDAGLPHTHASQHASPTSAPPAEDQRPIATNGLALCTDDEARNLKLLSEAVSANGTARACGHNGNLILFSHSHQPEHTADAEEAEMHKQGSWTAALLRSMRCEDDLLAILSSTASEVHRLSQGPHRTPQRPWVFYKPGVHASCSLAR